MRMKKSLSRTGDEGGKSAMGSSFYTLLPVAHGFLNAQCFHIPTNQSSNIGW